MSKLALRQAEKKATTILGSMNWCMSDAADNEKKILNELFSLCAARQGQIKLIDHGPDTRDEVGKSATN